MGIQEFLDSRHSFYIVLKIAYLCNMILVAPLLNMIMIILLLNFDYWICILSLRVTCHMYHVYLAPSYSVSCHVQIFASSLQHFAVFVTHIVSFPVSRIPLLSAILNWYKSLLVHFVNCNRFYYCYIVNLINQKITYQITFHGYQIIILLSIELCQNAQTIHVRFLSEY